MSAGVNCMEKRPKLISKLDAYKNQNGNNVLGYFCNSKKSSLSGDMNAANSKIYLASVVHVHRTT